jgi:hypothetical protein
MEKKDLDRRVRALTTLTKDHEVADLAESYFDSEHPLSVVIFVVFILPCFFLLFFALYLSDCFVFSGSSTSCFSPSCPRGRAIQHVPVSAASEAPETEDSHDGDEGEDSLERSSSTTSPPPALSKDLVVDKKRKHVKEIASSSASAPKTVVGESFEPEDGGELFDYMDS